MPTKPSTQPEAWATDAVYTTGPFVGQPQKVVPPAAFAAEGHRPGALFPTPAEYENSQQYNLTGLVRWLFLGTSSPDPDAHVVETDATGRAGLHGLTISNALNETALAVFSVSTTQPAMLITNTSGAICYGASMGNNDGWGFYTVTGNSAFPNGFRCEMISTGAGGRGLLVDADASTSGNCVDLTHSGSGTALSIAHSGTGSAVTVTGNATIQAMTVTGGAGQAAIAGVSGANATAAIGGAGTGTAIGVTGDGGNGSSAGTGVRGTGVHADAAGVHGRTSVSASTTAVGVLGEGRGAGTTGVHALSQVGRGLLVQGDASSPAYSAMRIVPQDADPSSATLDGEIIWHSSHRQLRTCIAGHGYRSMPTFGPGSAFVVTASQAVGAVDAVGSAYGPLLSVVCDASAGTGFYGSANNAEVQIKLSLCVRSVVASSVAEYLNLIIIDVTNGGATIAEWSGAALAADSAFSFIATTTGWIGTVSIGLRYRPPADGDLEIRVEAGHPAANNNLEIRNAVLEVIGTF